jgi:hypothetical protein
MRSGRCDVKEERPEVAEVIKLLRYAVSVLGPIPEVGKKLAVHRRYLHRLSEGKGEIKLGRVVDICRALDLEPSEFFRLTYRDTPRLAFAGQFLYQMWERHHRDQGPAPLRPPLRHKDSGHAGGETDREGEG